MSVPPATGPPFGEPGLPDLDEPTDAELLGLWPDPYAGPPDGDDAWLADLSLPELDALADQWAAGIAPAPEAIGAGFTQDLPGDAPAGFAAGGPLDDLPPSPVLAGFAAAAFEAGFGALSDDELVGVLGAARRLESWQAAMEFTAVAELDRRRRAQARRPGSSAVHDHVNAELAAALVLTGRSADAVLGMARGLARLPAVLAALAAGQLDRDRAAVFVAELAALDDRAAEAIARAFTGRAGQLTTGQLRWALRAMVLSLHPGTARQRAERGRRQTRVEFWPEGSGNAGLAGRELPAAEAIAADARITAIAEALKQAGAPGGLDELRAAVFTALLTGRDPASLYPGCPVPAPLTGSVDLTLPLSTWLGSSGAPGEVAGSGPADAGTCRDLADRLAAAGPGTRWCLTLTDPHGHAVAHGCARDGPGLGQPGRPPPPTGPPGDPRRAWLASTGPPGDPRLAWLASIPLSRLGQAPCPHPRLSYRPSRKLRHLIAVRHRTCGFPGCSRPARRCDADHTVPYDQGGLTCECNLAPLCRQHHKTKQAFGWHLTQAQPGILTWTTPHGRTYTTTPARYPV